MASIAGGEFRILLSNDGGSSYKGFALESDCSFELNAETRETTSKEDASFRSYVTSAKTWSVSGSGLFGNGATDWDPDELYNFLGTSVTLKITQTDIGTITPTSGKQNITGAAILTQLSGSFADKDNATYSFSLQGTGAWTEATN
jgi:predicted secreted protein